MNKALEHLPQDKQDELDIIRDIILENIPNARMIILFGSYARNEWVEDTHYEDNATHVYESDYDILVATKSKKDADNITLHHNIKQAIDATGKITTPISIIYHTFGEFNQQIIEGHYFFSDIKKEGIHLYRSSKHSLSKIKLLSPEERKKVTQEHFDQWFKKANEFYDYYELGLKKHHYKTAAFQLHQAVESLYSVVTLVFINYRYRSHDIEILGHHAVKYNEKFATVFPMETDEQKENLKLLRKAYIDARYKDTYEITEGQLKYLAERVKILMTLTEDICIQKIESFV